jgi:predicted MarR family transcription regulator
VDILVFHHVAHRRSAKRVADICFVLDIEDTHVVTYSLRKLARLGFVTSERRGKEAFYRVTDKGWAWCLQYRRVRDACLIPAFSGEVSENQELARTAKTLRMLSGRYDQAARAATTTPPTGAEEGDEEHNRTDR